MLTIICLDERNERCGFFRPFMLHQKLKNGKKIISKEKIYFGEIAIVSLNYIDSYRAKKEFKR